MNELGTHPCSQGLKQEGYVLEVNLTELHSNVKVSLGYTATSCLQRKWWRGGRTSQRHCLWELQIEWTKFIGSGKELSVDTTRMNFRVKVKHREASLKGCMGYSCKVQTTAESVYGKWLEWWLPGQGRIITGVQNNEGIGNTDDFWTWAIQNQKLIKP